MNFRKVALRVLVDLVLHQQDLDVQVVSLVCFSLGLHYLAFWDRNALE